MEKFGKDGFKKSAALFRARLEHGSQIAAQVKRAISIAGEAAIHLVALSRERTAEEPLKKTCFGFECAL